MASIISTILGAVLDVDRIDMKSEGDYVIKTYTTTALRGIGDRFVDKKIKLFDLLDPPVKLPGSSKVISKEKLEDNPLFTQWNVTVKVKKRGL